MLYFMVSVRRLWRFSWTTFPSMEPPLTTVSTILIRFCRDVKNKFGAQLGKVPFKVNKGIVLGHKISERGIEVDKAKIEAIERMPYHIKGIRSFLGHAGFYRRFIKDSSKTSIPLTNLLQKDTPFVFDEDCK